MARNETVKDDNVLQNTAPGIDAELISSMKEEVLRAKEENIPMLQAFEAVAKKSGLKVNTIRNYYYRYLHSHLGGERKSGDKKENIQSFNAIAGKSFTEGEVKNIVITILKGQAEGESVRACANRLANGDPKRMLRLQNKYRNVISSQPEYVESLMAEMSQKGISYFNPYTKQIIKGSKHATEEKSVIESTRGSVESVPVESVSKVETNSHSRQNTGGSLIETIRDAIDGLNELDDFSVEEFFKGLKKLVDMAVRGRESNDTEKLIYIERVCKDFENKLNRINNFMHQLIDINERFVSLPDVQKLSMLSDYVDELTVWIDMYKKLYRDTLTERS